MPPGSLLLRPLCMLTEAREAEQVHKRESVFCVGRSFCGLYMLCLVAVLASTAFVPPLCLEYVCTAPCWVLLVPTGSL
jgi:hypothetical protein